MKKKKKAVLLTALMLLIGAVVGYQVHLYIGEAEIQEALEKYARDGVLIYGAHESAPPLRFVDSDGVYKGVVVDYVNQLSLEMGIKIDMVPYPWDEAQEALKVGKTDLCDMFINQERSKYFVFSDPIYNLRVVLAVAEDSDFTLDDVGTMTIATERGDYANGYLQTQYPSAELVYVKDVSEGVSLLSKGLVDAAIGDEPVVYYYMNQRTDGFRFRVINTALYEEPVVLAVPKAKAGLLPVLNHAIKRVNSSGALEKIQQKWFGLSIPLLENGSGRKLALWFSAAFFTIGALFAVGQWNNRNLKHQVRERTEVLERSQNELQLIFDGIPEYIVVLNRDKKIVRINQGLLQHLQLNDSQVQGESCRTVLAGFCGDCDQCILERSVERGGVIQEEVSFKNEVYEMAAYPLDGIQDGGLVTLRNITFEQVQRKQLLQSAKMMAVGQLAAGMAHEMRNPLGIIRTQSYLLRSNENLDENARKSLSFIDENVQRAGLIIDNVMNFWRSGEGREEQLNLSDNMRSIVALQNDEIRSKEISVQICCPPDLTLTADPETLKHILLNLISNAVDAMGRGGHLLLTAKETGAGLELQCSDDGCGIPQEDMEMLFNPFFTTKPPGKGTGLGMFVVYSEVEKLSGTIRVDSVPGKGTRFTVEIPGREEKGDEGNL